MSADNYLTPEQCQIALYNRFKTKDIKFLTSAVNPISKDCEGFMGEHYKLTLTYEENGKISTEIFFFKKKPSDKSHAEMVEQGHMFEREILFYNVFQKEFEKKGYDISFSPKSYYCILNEAIIMENLSAEGYTILERNKKFDLNKMKCFLKALALYHGAGFAYENTRTKELGKNYKFTDDYGDILREEYFCQYIDKKPLADEFWNASNETLLSLIDMLPKNKEYIDEFKTLFINYKMGKIFADETNLPKTCGHGDLWSNNLMFKFAGNNVTECRLIDFQILRYFYPTYDVCLAIYCNTDLKFREKHLQELLTYYYETLTEILNNYGYSIEDIMTLEQYYKMIHLVKVESLCQVAFVSSIVCIPKEILTESMKDAKNALETMMFNNSGQAVKAFKTHEIFRNILIDILYDLHDALVSRKDDED